MTSEVTLLANFRRRVTSLYLSYGEIDDLEGTVQAEAKETVEAILWARDRRGAAYDPNNDAERELAYTRRSIDDLASSVRAAIIDALVEADEEWGGIEYALPAYRRELTDLRGLRGDLRKLKADIDRICADLD